MDKETLLKGIEIAEILTSGNLPCTKPARDDAYYIVRTQTAGVFAGRIESRDGPEVIMVNARRLWYWDGAASLSQLAMEGVSKPDKCKFPCEVSRITLTQAIEIIVTTAKAEASIKAVAIWKME